MLIIIGLSDYSRQELQTLVQTLFCFSNPLVNEAAPLSCEKVLTAVSTSAHVASALRERTFFLQELMPLTFTFLAPKHYGDTQEMVVKWVKYWDAENF